MNNIDLNTKYTIAYNWILREDPHNLPQRYSAYDITSRLTLSLPLPYYIILKIFYTKSLSFSDLYNAIEQKGIKMDWNAFWQFCDKINPLSFFTPSEKPFHSKDEFPNGDNVSGYDIPIASSPYTVELHFTHNCNLKCKHCFQNSSPQSNKYKELTPNEWINIFEQFEAIRVRNVTLTGGEIMFYPYFDKVFKEIVNKRINYRVLTNGTLINDNNIDDLSKENVSLSISLDGHSSQTHDFLRGNGTFQRTITNIKNLVKNGAKVSLVYTINTNNYLYLEEAIQLAISLRVKGFLLEFTDRIGRANENLSLILSNSQREMVRQNFIQLKKKYENSFEELALIELATLQRKMEFPNNQLYCTAGTSHIAVSSDGKLYPCIYAFGHQEFLIGDLTKENLKDLWENKNKWKTFRNGFNLKNIETCSNCALAPKCSLKVCRLRNYEQNHSLYNKPIECALDYSISL